MARTPCFTSAGARLAYGTEQFWHGVLYHHGQPGRRYDEFKTIGSELKRSGKYFLETENRSQVAMLLSYARAWALKGQSSHSAFEYSPLFASYYRALHNRNVGVDITPPDADLSRDRLVIAPALYVLPQETADNLRQFVQNCGTLMITARTGAKDEANAVVTSYLPGLLAEVCGVEVDEYDVRSADAVVPLALAYLVGTQTAQARLWFDVLRPVTSQTIAGYQGEYFSGTAAITLNRFGNGRVIYLGTLAMTTCRIFCWTGP